MKFSERMGYTKPKEVIQYEYIDKDLQNGLWNILISFYIPSKYSNYYFSQIPQQYTDLYKSIWIHSLKNRLDEFPSLQSLFKKHIESIFYGNTNWYELYDLLEDFFKHSNILEWNNVTQNSFVHTINKILKRELSGYRFINGLFVPITNEQEIESIEEAITNTEEYNNITIHLNKALDLLSDKQNPDYNNSIKESISAIESYFKVFFNKKNIAFGTALTKLEKEHGLNGSIKGAIQNIYGYVNNNGAIRHSLKPREISTITLAEAKYMLVSCSAFINYLKELTAK